MHVAADDQPGDHLLDKSLLAKSLAGGIMGCSMEARRLGEHIAVPICR